MDVVPLRRAVSAADMPHPEWFAGKKYEYPNLRDLPGWLRELERICGLAWKGREEWRGVLPDINNWVPSYIGPSPVEAIEREEASRELSALEHPRFLSAFT